MIVHVCSCYIPYISYIAPHPPNATSIKTDVKNKQIKVKFQENVNCYDKILYPNKLSVLMQDPVNIYDRIGNLTQFLAATYILSFYDAYSNKSCGSTSINASSCVHQVCCINYSINYILSSCIHSNQVKIIIYAINVFGNGSKSEPVIISVGKLHRLL